jgi:hypothetical protein
VAAGSLSDCRRLITLSPWSIWWNPGPSVGLCFHGWIGCRKLRRALLKASH